MSEMTYKQAIKILSEAKVADMPYKGAQSNHKMYDIARRMAIEALKEKAAAEEKNETHTTAAPAADITINIGDVIPFRARTGRVISYVVEKIKTSEDGMVKFRCRHGGGGQSRSFLEGEAKNLIRSGGLYYCEPEKENR